MFINLRLRLSSSSSLALKGTGGDISPLLVNIHGIKQKKLKPNERYGEHPWHPQLENGAMVLPTGIT